MAGRAKRTAESSTGRVAAPHSSRWPWIVLVMVLTFTAGVRLRLLDTPLERDEGEYAYAGQLMLAAVPPYGQIYNMKLPGTYAAYAVIEAVFGQTTSAIHLGLLLVNACAIVLVFLLGRSLFGSAAGAIAAASYGLLSLSPSVLGTSAHATHFVVVPALGGFLLLVRNRDSIRLSMALLSGFLFGLAFLMKQQAIFYLVFAWIVFAWMQWRDSSSKRLRVVMRLALFTSALAAPFALTCLLLWQAGVWDSFWFWTFRYAREYVSIVPLDAGWQNLKDGFLGVVGPFLWVWALSAAGLLSLLIDKQLPSPARVSTLLFVLFSILTVTPGLYFRSHYFVTVLPAVALLAGNGCLACGRQIAARGLTTAQTKTPVLLALFALSWPLIQQRSFLFAANPIEASRTLYGLEPFPEAVEIGRYLQEHSAPGDRIAVLGAEPQIYFYAQRRSATGYIYVYGIWEDQPLADRMAAEMTREIEAAQPRYVVVEFVPQRLLAWSREYLRHFELDGRIEMISNDKTEYYWGAQAQTRATRSARQLYVFKRSNT